MKLKTVEVDGKTYAEVLDGKPVYVHDDGKEAPFDAPATVAKIGQLNNEAKTHREGKEAAESKLKAFEGITDPVAAKKALETVKNFDDKKLVDAGEVEKVKTAAIEAIEAKYAPMVEENGALKSQLSDALIGNAFAQSKFIGEKVAVPLPMLRKTYGENFKIEDGKVVPYDAAGNVIRSRVNAGDVASFDEAIEAIISADPFKDHILKSDGSGGGTKGGSGGGPGGAKTITRAEFDGMDQTERAAKMKDGFKVVDAA